MATDILTRNMVRQAGNGTRPMLFAHGFGCNQDMWRYVAPSFEDDFRTILFDYVGAGELTVESLSGRGSFNPLAVKFERPEHPPITVRLPPALEFHPVSPDSGALPENVEDPDPFRLDDSMGLTPPRPK